MSSFISVLKNTTTQPENMKETEKIIIIVRSHTVAQSPDGGGGGSGGIVGKREVLHGLLFV